MAKQLSSFGAVFGLNHDRIGAIVSHVIEKEYLWAGFTAQQGFAVVDARDIGSETGYGAAIFVNMPSAIDGDIEVRVVVLSVDECSTLGLTLDSVSLDRRGLSQGLHAGHMGFARVGDRLELMRVA